MHADSFEFWQSRKNDVTDRILYRREKPGEKINPELTHKGVNRWLLERLAP